ncbi:hypothetical protein HK102_012102, partial [Quaeritorhiza haematococci]
RGELIETRDGVAVNRVVQFREKPDRDTAEQFLASGSFAWNSGIFLWRARTILQEINRHKPLLGAALHRDTKNSLLISDDGGLIAAIGLDDVVVVQSGKATLVARRDQLDKLKALVESLNDRGYGSYL